jgi:hypothetical protein
LCHGAHGPRPRLPVYCARSSLEPAPHLARRARTRRASNPRLAGAARRAQPWLELDMPAPVRSSWLLPLSEARRRRACHWPELVMSASG